MMEKFGSKRMVRLMSLFIAGIFVVGCFALSVMQSDFGSRAEAASSNSAIGIVDFQKVVGASPLIENVRTTMQNEFAAADKDFAAKAKTMSDQEKQKYGKQLQTRLMNREQELMTPVLSQVNAAIKKVADKKGLSLVVHKNTVIYGGVDITEEVVKSFGK